MSNGTETAVANVDRKNVVLGEIGAAEVLTVEAREATDLVTLVPPAGLVVANP